MISKNGTSLLGGVYVFSPEFRVGSTFFFPGENRKTTRLQDYKFILKISTCVINAQSMQLLSRIFQDISRAIESRYLIVT